MAVGLRWTQYDGREVAILKILYFVIGRFSFGIFLDFDIFLSILADMGNSKTLVEI